MRLLAVHQSIYRRIPHPNAIALDAEDDLQGDRLLSCQCPGLSPRLYFLLRCAKLTTAEWRGHRSHLGRTAPSHQLRRVAPRMAEAHKKGVVRVSQLARSQLLMNKDTETDDHRQQGSTHHIQRAVPSISVRAGLFSVQSHEGFWRGEENQGKPKKSDNGAAFVPCRPDMGNRQFRIHRQASIDGVDGFSTSHMGVGMSLEFSTQIHLGRNYSTTLHMSEKQSLITTGPYRHIRHPMYTALITVGIGMGLTSTSWYFLLPFVATGIVVAFRVRREEEAMIEKFGEAYIEYAKGTGMFLPPVGRKRRR